MMQLTSAQVTYLLYVFAYRDPASHSVTRSVAGSGLAPDDRAGESQLFDVLKSAHLIEETGRRRIVLTEQGKATLKANLPRLHFTSVKGPRILNALVQLIDVTPVSLTNSSASPISQQAGNGSGKEGGNGASNGTLNNGASNGQPNLTYQAFEPLLREIYRQVRHKQAIAGVVAIDRPSLLQEFERQHRGTFGCSIDLIESYFNQMREEEKVFLTIDNHRELIELV